MKQSPPLPTGRVVSLWTAITVLTGVAVLAFAAFAAAGHRRSGVEGMQAAGVAAVTCWGGALIALLLTAFLTGPQRFVAVLAGMLFRTGLPLVVGLWLHQRGGGLAEAGVLGMMVLFYLITLATETLLAVRLTKTN